MRLAVNVQAHQPMASDAAITKPMAKGESQRCITRNANQAQSVPAVPGATGDRPEPKPSAMQWAGCDSMKRAVGRTTGGRSGGLSGMFIVS
jgi:hypothetical protein